jgi:beta-fructofuranosidase
MLNFNVTIAGGRKMALRFHSEKNRIVADIIPFFDNGYYHVYYLKGFTEGVGWSRHQTPWAHIRSKDLINWDNLPNALETGLQREQDGGACFTGSVFRQGEQIHIFYTGFNPGSTQGREQIMHAVSEDGIHFRKNEKNPVLMLETPYYGAGEDFRDPFVLWNEEELCYWMLFTAGDRRPLSGVRRGVIGLAVSKDLQKWSFRPPLYAPNNYPSLECPDLFRIGDWWYLLFSQFGRTEYRKSSTPTGPWELPQYPHFDAGDYFFYAAKTMSDGDKRFLLGWCGELAGNKDANQALWGGSFVTPRELVQKENGELELKCPEAFLQLFTGMENEEYNQLRQILGQWAFSENTAVSHNDIGFASCLMDERLANASVKMTIAVPRHYGRVGVLLRSSDNHSHCYTVTIDLGIRMLSLERYYSVEAFHGSTLSGPRVICTRTLPEQIDESLELILFLKDDIVEVFIAGVTLTAPLKDIKEGRFGLFTSDTRATFSDISIR